MCDVELCDVECRRPKASIAARATAKPSIECKSQWHGHVECVMSCDVELCDVECVMSSV